MTTNFKVVWCPYLMLHPMHICVYTQMAKYNTSSQKKKKKKSQPPCMGPGLGCAYLTVAIFPKLSTNIRVFIEPLLSNKKD